MKKHHLLLLAAVMGICRLCHAQDLGNIKSQKPFTWQGSIGASANFYTSTEPVYTQPPYAWNVYGNFTGNLYGVALPFSFVINQYGKSYNSPFTQFGLSPTYKWAKLHLGYRNMLFSPLTFEGQSFRGAGLELNPGIFRFAAFIGKLNRAVNEDTTSGRFTLPQFSRKAYGAKIGVGSTNNYFDLIYFKAKDDSSSAKLLGKTGLRPQENSVLGSSFKVTLLKKRIVFTGDVALSALRQDLAFEKDTIGNKFLDKLLQANTSTTLPWAVQSLVSFNFTNVQTGIGYRRVHRDFKSFGTPYMLNDIVMLSLTNNLMLRKGKLNIATAIGTQHNNLAKNLSSELHTTTGNLNINSIFSPKFTVNLNATGYALHQQDGTEALKDSARLKQQVFQLSLSPVYMLAGSSGTSTFSGNLTVGGLNDKNPATRAFNKNKNVSGALTFSRYLAQKALNFSLTGMHNRFTQGDNLFTSTGFTVGAGAQLLKEKNLGLQGTVGYLFNNYQTAKAGGNVTFSFNAGYNKSRHTLNAFANYIITTPGSIAPTPDKAPYAVMTRNVAGGISYGYSF